MDAKHTTEILRVLGEAQTALELKDHCSSPEQLARRIQSAHEGVGRAMKMIELAIKLGDLP